MYMLVSVANKEFAKNSPSNSEIDRESGRIIPAPELFTQYHAATGKMRMLVANALGITGFMLDKEFEKAKPEHDFAIGDFSAYAVDKNGVRHIWRIFKLNTDIHEL